MTPSIGRARQSIREASYAYPQSTLDALADAAALRDIAYELLPVGASIEFAVAACNGWVARQWSGKSDERAAENAQHFAREAASAAFRAVPGLRDEEAE